MKAEGTLDRRGLNVVEVGIVVAIILIVLLYLMLRLPRSRETSRMAGCQMNLRQIGVALAQYHADVGHLPTAWLQGQGPLRACLEQLAIPDFSGLTDPKTRVARKSGFVSQERFVAGFTCPTDRAILSNVLLAPVSYRACTGSTPDGSGGAFAIGLAVKYGQVEERDGLSYTAAFSERLVGRKLADPRSDPSTMQFVPATLTAPPCPRGSPGAWLDDAGKTWWTASWANTLYNHALPPNASPQCLSANGGTGLVGASSEHVTGVNVLLMDGGVRSYTGRVAPQI